MKKQKNKVVSYLLAIFSVLSTQCVSTPLHYEHAKDTFLKDQNLDVFENNKQLIKEYYLSDAYETDLKVACTQAKAYFDSLIVTDNSLVIFDVDDTAVIHYHRIDRFEYIWGQQPHLVANIQIGKATVIKPVLELYNYLINKGYKIIFMSGRYEGMRADTVQELQSAGYLKYEKLILFPTLYPPNGILAAWKVTMRKELSEQYALVASVGDRVHDFDGGYTGHIIKLPNYLY